MELPDFDKIKINNAIIVFLIIISCVLAPLTVLIIIDSKLIYNPDSLKIVVATTCIGFTHFGFLYVLNAAWASMSYERNWEDEKLVNHLFRMPLLSTSCLLIIIYGMLCILNLRAPQSATDNKMILMSTDMGVILGIVVEFLFKIFKKKAAPVEP